MEVVFVAVVLNFQVPFFVAAEHFFCDDFTDFAHAAFLLRVQSRQEGADFVGFLEAWQIGFHVPFVFLEFFCDFPDAFIAAV